MAVREEMAVREVSLMRLDPQALIAKAIEAGSGIDTMERLVALAKDVREVQAKEAWYAAMAEFQRTCPSIKKTATANIQGRATYSYSWAPLDEILTVVQPVMGPLGLSVAWRQRIEPSQVIISCLVSHALGHAESSGEIAIPIVQSDGTGATPAQRVGIAITYAKRYSLLGIIGMAPEDDDDAQSQEDRPAQVQVQDASTEEAPRLITEPQIKRLYAIARGSGWTDDQAHDLLASWHYNSSKEIAVADYDKIIEKLKAGPPKA